MMAYLFEIFIYAMYIKKKELAAEIKFDIYKLQLCRCESHFNAGRDLFLAKWLDISEEVIEFMQYFNAQWFVKEPFWFEGYNPASI